VDERQMDYLQKLEMVEYYPDLPPWARTEKPSMLPRGDGRGLSDPDSVQRNVLKGMTS